MNTMDFIGFSKNAFILFDRYESLTLAYLFSPFGKEARLLFRKKLNQAMIDKIVREKNITLNLENRKRLSIITSLVNAKIWHDIKTDYGYSGAEISDTIEWALTSLLEKI